MLVAEKRDYLESYYPQYEEEQHKIQKPSVAPKTRPKTRPKPRNRFVPIFLVAVGFALCSVCISRYAAIAENQRNITRLENTLAQELERQNNLKVEFAAGQNLYMIEEKAAELGMNFPESGQILYVELPKDKEDTREVQLAQEESQGSIWDKIIGLID